MIAGRYTVLEELGRGGMGVVVRARDETLGRDVAIKQVLAPDGLSAEAAEVRRQRMMREARAAARIRHGNVVTVHDVLAEDGVVHIVMEYVPGRSLTRLVADEGPLAAGRTARIGLALLDVLAAAHALGIVHRDVKPANVLVLPGDEVKLADFGIAFLEGDPTLTSDRALLGSPGYMSPEQARGRPVTPATDLWSLAATLYFAVEGRGPFDADSAAAAIAAVVADAPAPPRAPGPDLGEVLFRLLNKEPEARPDASWTRTMLARAAGSAHPSHPEPPRPAAAAPEASGAAGPAPVAPPSQVAPSTRVTGPHADAFVARIKAGTLARKAGSRWRVRGLWLLAVAAVWVVVWPSQAAETVNDLASGGGVLRALGFTLLAVVLVGLLSTAHAVWMFFFELVTPRRLRVSADGIELVRGLRRVRFGWPGIASVGIVQGHGPKPRSALMLHPRYDHAGADPFAGQRLSWTPARSPWRDKAADAIGLCYLDELATSPGRLDAALRHFARQAAPPPG